VPGRLSRCKRGRRARVAAPPPGGRAGTGADEARYLRLTELGPEAEANAERLKPEQSTEIHTVESADMRFQSSHTDRRASASVNSDLRLGSSS
jgi:hypothetical protein